MLILVLILVLILILILILMLYPSHVPYTTDQDGFSMSQRTVLMHSFDLTDAGMLPEPMLRAIAKHPYVWWDPLYDANKRTKTTPERGVSDEERQETTIASQ